MHDDVDDDVVHWPDRCVSPSGAENASKTRPGELLRKWQVGATRRSSKKGCARGQQIKSQVFESSMFARQVGPLPRGEDLKSQFLEAPCLHGRLDPSPGKELMNT